MNLPEIMARSIYETTANAERVPWDNVDAHVKVFQCRLQMTALKAIREPTEAMIVAASGWLPDRWLIETVWRAMIDAELSAEKPPDVYAEIRRVEAEYKHGAGR